MAEQLQRKRELLGRELRRYDSLKGARLLDTLPSPEGVGYRNRARMAVGLSRHGGATLGYFRAGTREIVDAPECGVLVPELLETTRRIRNLLTAARNIPRELRHLDLRCGSDPRRQHLTLVFRATEMPRFPLEALAARGAGGRRHLGQPESEQRAAGDPRLDPAPVGPARDLGAACRDEAARLAGRVLPGQPVDPAGDPRVDGSLPDRRRAADRPVRRRRHARAGAADTSTAGCCSPRGRAPRWPTSSRPRARSGGTTSRCCRRRWSARCASCANGGPTPSC